MQSTEVKTFPVGGIHPPDYKISANKPIEKLPLPETVAILLSQHIGAPATPVVQINDKVKAGQLIARGESFISANIHSSVSGTVMKIDSVADTTGYKKKAIIIKVENDDWGEGIDLSPDIKNEITATPKEIIAKIKEAGVVGLGGATFPSHVKLMPPEGKKAEYLLINGVECEPYLTSDHRIMLEKGKELLIGVEILMKGLNVNRALIGIENNKTDAIEHLRNLAVNYQGIEIIALKMQYPQGGERQLVKALVNREIPPPPKGLPIDVGCVVFNVATTVAVYDAVQKNKPLVERVVSITGKSVKNPSNLQVRIGTSLENLIEAAGGLPEDTGKIINGGPMMGKALSTIDVPMTKGIGGVVLFPEKEATRKETIECIRCAKCVSVCPLGLEPYLLMRLSELKRFDQAKSEKILNCCECACCSYACPSNRPLVDYIRLGKTTVLNILKSRSHK